MISNHCTYNAHPLAVAADLLCFDSPLAFVQPTKFRKRSMVLSFRPINCSYGCSSHAVEALDSAPAGKKRRLSPPARKSVRFAEEANRVYLKTVSAEDLDRSWYGLAEIATFKHDSKRSVLELYLANMNGDCSSLPQDHCIRGLEQVVTPSAALAQKRARKERVAAVLIQQQLQRETGTCNPELLQLISLLCSQQRCQDAVRMGAMDAQVWAEYF